MATELEFRSVSRRFAAHGKAGLGKAGAVTAIEGLSFSLEKGEFVAVLGPSGCGKSTLLGLAAGLDQPSSGLVLVEGQKVLGPNPRVAFMLQKDLLLPWRNLADNIALGLEVGDLPTAEKQARVRRELQRARLTEFAQAWPHQLSGGMRQRAALARTLAVDPAIILLDEPVSALDAQTKLTLQRSFAATIAGAGVTALLITHDVSEAIAMADRVLVMSPRPGRIIETFPIDLPNRDDPLARTREPRFRGLFDHLFEQLQQDDELVA